MFTTLEYFITQNLLSVIYVCINNVWDAYPNLSHLSVIDLLNSIWQDSHLTTFFFFGCLTLIIVQKLKENLIRHISYFISVYKEEANVAH